jgi:hypothetical protein
MRLDWVGSPSHDYPGSQVQGRISITEVARPCTGTQGDQRVQARTVGHVGMRSGALFVSEWDGIGQDALPNGWGS